MGHPTALDLFCGCGGLSWGFRQAGFATLAGIDNWAPALRTFQLNHPEAATICEDLTTASPSETMRRLNIRSGDLDCLIGGPPCQGFSKNVPATYRFLEDPRNQLFKEFLWFAHELYPKTILMENVAEIYNAFGGQVRDEIIASLMTLGYAVKAQVLNAADYGVPQTRRRCFFLASRTGIKPSFPQPGFGPNQFSTLFETVYKYRSAWSAISDLPKLENGEGFEPMPYDQPAENDYQADMRIASSQVYDHITRKLNDTQFARISSLEAGEGIKELPSEIRPRSGYSGAYGRLNFTAPAPTITRWVFHPGSGRYCHPREVRLITIREAARLQSFSDDFRFTGTYIQKSHQVGNAVPPVLARQLAEELRACCVDSVETTVRQLLPQEAAV